MLNNVVYIGRTTKNVVVYKNAKGVPFCIFSLAVQRDFKNEKGIKETDFIKCIAYNKKVENLNQYVGKGSLISITGSTMTKIKEYKGIKYNDSLCLIKDIGFLDTKKPGEIEEFIQNPTDFTQEDINMLQNDDFNELSSLQKGKIKMEKNIIEVENDLYIVEDDEKDSEGFLNISSLKNKEQKKIKVDGLQKGDVIEV